ncbi:MAG: hypothetical protein LBC97_05035 [Bifidobacteriaceae bacterium]|jgi:hypothetical protein|nr:hypothetical protein [Bifidobacteriaceae bacterium]
MTARIVVFCCGLALASGVMAGCAVEAEAGGCGLQALMAVGLSAQEAAPGEVLDLTGGDAFTHCPFNDKGELDARGWTASPLEDLPVIWIQGDQSTTLTVIDADEEGKLAVSIKIPADATPGKATIVVGSEQVGEVAQVDLLIVGERG